MTEKPKAISLNEVQHRHRVKPWQESTVYRAKELDAWLEERDKKLARLFEDAVRQDRQSLIGWLRSVTKLMPYKMWGKMSQGRIERVMDILANLRIELISPNPHKTGKFGEVIAALRGGQKE